MKEVFLTFIMLEALLVLILDALIYHKQFDATFPECFDFINNRVVALKVEFGLPGRYSFT